MIVMISNHCLDNAEEELGADCEQIFTPESRHQAKRMDARFCIDNGAYSNWEPVSFASLLERELPRRHKGFFEACRKCSLNWAYSDNWEPQSTK